MQRPRSKKLTIIFSRDRRAVRPSTQRFYVGLAQTDLGELSRGRADVSRSPYRQPRPCAVPSRCCLPASPSRGRCSGRNGRRMRGRFWSRLTPAGDAVCCARYWCLVARLQEHGDALSDAWHAVERARPMSCGISPVLESLVRLQEASVQARIGDLEAVRVHVTAGLAAARAAAPAAAGDQVEAGARGRASSEPLDRALHAWRPGICTDPRRGRSTALDAANPVGVEGARQAACRLASRRRACHVGHGKRRCPSSTTCAIFWRFRISPKTRRASRTGGDRHSTAHARRRRWHLRVGSAVVSAGWRLGLGE